jgi:phosphatidylinositol alpha-1,6-mannosyltransferase
MTEEPPVVITLEYPPERGGLARYLGELVRCSGLNMEVIVPAARGIEGPGNIAPKEMFREAWPHWWPLVRICRNAGNRASKIIISHVLPAGTAAMISRVLGGPHYVIICHGVDVRMASAAPRKRTLFRIICWMADAVVANSKSTAAAIQKITGIRAKIITPGVSSFEVMSRREARARLGVPEEDRIVLSVGRLVERKGLSTVIDAVKRLPASERIRLIIIGDGPEYPFLFRSASERPGLVRFITNASDEHVREWYAAADVFCLPVKETPDDVEGFGIVFLEAALAGLPVIAGKAGGAVEAVVDRETGILVNPYDAGEVERALSLLLNDPDRARRMGEAGRARAERDFRWEDRWRAFEEILQ